MSIDFDELRRKNEEEYRVKYGAWKCDFPQNIDELKQLVYNTTITSAIELRVSLFEWCAYILENYPHLVKYCEIKGTFNSVNLWLFVHHTIKSEKDTYCVDHRPRITHLQSVSISETSWTFQQYSVSYSRSFSFYHGYKPRRMRWHLGHYVFDGPNLEYNPKRLAQYCYDNNRIESIDKFKEFLLRLDILDRKLCKIGGRYWKGAIKKRKIAVVNNRKKRNKKHVESI